MGIGTSGTSSTYSLYLNKGVFAQSRIDATIFYDTNNTGYYADPASTNNFNQTEQNGRMWYSNYTVSRNEGGMMGSYNATGTASKVIWTIGESWPIGNMYGLAYEYGSGYDHHLALRNNGSTYHRISFAGQGAYFSGTVIAGSDMRAPIFYDQNNTGYYLNPDSTSQLHYVLANNWFRAQGSSGFYTQDYGSHWRTSFASAYGTWESFGYSKNGWAGLNIIDPSGYWNNYMHESGNGGLYQQNGSGWVWYWSRGNGCLGLGGSSTVGGYRARVNGALYVDSTMYSGGAVYGTIFYDSNNSGYYVDPTAGSYFAGSIELANGYFLTNGAGGAIFVSAVQGSFGGYIRCARHLVIETYQAGHHTYVIDTATGVGVVRYYATQYWSAHSDRTMKTVHSNITNTLDKLNDITPVYYSFNHVENDTNRIGLIAQEVEVHYPELVRTDPMNDKLTLDYTGMIPILLAAIKELKAELDVVKEELNTLKNQ
jgi:hypothetical protein